MIVGNAQQNVTFIIADMGAYNLGSITSSSKLAGEYSISRISYLFLYTQAMSCGRHHSENWGGPELRP